MATKQKNTAQKKETVKAEVSAAEKEKPKAKKAKAPAKKTKAKTNAKNNRQIKQTIQNARTFRSGEMKTIEVTLKFKSDMMNNYLMNNTRSILIAFERLAQIYRLTSDSKKAYEHVRDWQLGNMQICQTQLDELIVQRETIQKQMELQTIAPNIPDSYEVIFEFSHPVGLQVYNLMQSVDSELDEIELIFLAGGIDDLEYQSAKQQAMSILRGCIDRIYKATSPGKREGGEFDTKRFVQMLREGYQMDNGVDKPRAFQQEVA